MESVIYALAKFLTETEQLHRSTEFMAFTPLCNGVKGQGAMATSFGKGNCHGARKKIPQ